MSTSEALKRAQAKYDKANTAMKCVKFNRNTEKDELHWLESRDEPFATYIKRLIREDMKKSIK